jgi:hypothetical protein
MTIVKSSLFAGVALAFASFAQASDVTLRLNDTVGGGTVRDLGAATFFGSDTFASALDTVKASVTAPGEALPQVFLPGARLPGFAARINAVTIDSSTNAVLNLTSTGGFNIAVSDATNVLCRTSTGATYNCGNGTATGGSVFVGNLTVDLVNKAIYGDVTGTGLALANSITNSKGVVLVAAHNAVIVNQVGIKLFDFSGLTGNATFDWLVVRPLLLDGNQATVGDLPAPYQFDLAGLTLTAAGTNAIRGALGLYSIGATVLQGAASDMGHLSVGATPSVPEAGTFALMGLGLMGVAWAARRRVK